MKVIDLLNKKANGEEVPEKFRFAGQIFEKQGSYIEDEDGDSIFDSMCTDFSNINEEIEVIEEDKKIEKLETYKEIDDEEYYANILKVSKNGEYEINEALSVVVDKINEIIDKINEEE